MCLESDVDPSYLATGAAAALRFDPVSDPSAVLLQEMILKQGIEWVVNDLAGDQSVAKSVLNAVESFGG